MLLLLSQLREMRADAREEKISDLIYLPLLLVEFQKLLAKWQAI